MTVHLRCPDSQGSNATSLVIVNWADNSLNSIIYTRIWRVKKEFIEEGTLLDNGLRDPTTYYKSHICKILQNILKREMK